MYIAMCACMYMYLQSYVYRHNGFGKVVVPNHTFGNTDFEYYNCGALVLDCSHAKFT